MASLALLKAWIASRIRPAYAEESLKISRDHVEEIPAGRVLGIAV